MAEVIRRLDGVSNGDGEVYHGAVVARDTHDGWDAWLEFTFGGRGTERVLVTGIETHQHDRVALERWASGLTAVYTEGALSRAIARHPETPDAALLGALEDIVAALDRRLPHVERASELAIAADARRLRAAALARIESLRQSADPSA